MNHFGQIFRVTIYGESHQDAVGVLVEGVTPGLAINQKMFEIDLERRRAGKVGTTLRIEADIPKFISGVFNEKATGAPLNISFQNQNILSKDYTQFKDIYRPSHSDFTSHCKFNGYHDYRGGGMFSGRLTVGIVAAGVIAKKMIPCTFTSTITQIGDLEDMLNIEEYIDTISKQKDSVGGIVEIVVSNVKSGLGEPFFDTIEGNISKILFAIPGIKGVEFGAGFKGANMLGSQFNDAFINEHGKTLTNHNGGINGGITNGNDLIIRVFVKPTPSIGKLQKTYDFANKKMTDLEISGRHDVAIIRRIPVVLENAIAIALADFYKLDKIYH